MIVQNNRPLPRIVEDALSAGSVHVSVGSIHQRAAVLSDAVPAVSVLETARRGFGAADADAVFLAGRLELAGGVAAGAAAEEQVVVVSAVDDPAELVGAFDVLARSVLLEVRVGGAFEDAQRRVGHGVLEDVVVERAKGQQRGGRGGLAEEVGVDAVVALVGRDADGAVVCPGAGLEGLGGRDADVRGVLCAPVRHAVVQVVGVADLGDVRGPEVVFTWEVDHGAVGEGRA